jgi:UDP-N-acetyl-D-mannosaminuronic acid dehydrogenase
MGCEKSSNTANTLFRYMEGVCVNFQKICVLGLGYIGLPTASTLCYTWYPGYWGGCKPARARYAQERCIHIHEPGLRTIVEAAIKSGKLTVSEQPEEADAFLIAVPTPFYSDKTGEYNDEIYNWPICGP